VSGGFLIDSDKLGITLPEPVAPTESQVVAPAESVAVADETTGDRLAPPPSADSSHTPQSRGAGDSLISSPSFGNDDPEAGFTDDLREAFGSGAPFMVVALRMPPDSPHLPHFPSVADGFLGALTGADRALVRDDEARLVAILPNAPADAPQRLMGAIRDHLNGLLGARADHVFGTVAVLVLPNGQPFSEPLPLLDYVLG
jgi:hypothetical protein